MVLDSRPFLGYTVSTMKVGDLVKVPYQGIGVLIYLTFMTALVQTFSGKRVRTHPSNLEVINENR